MLPKRTPLLLLAVAVASGWTKACAAEDIRDAVLSPPRRPSVPLMSVVDRASSGWAEAGRLPKSALPVPILRQATHYSCGAVALMSALYYWQVFDGPESALYERLNTTEKDGTEPPKIVEVARSFGLEAQMKEGTELADLRVALSRGETVILDLQAWRGAANKRKPWRQVWDEGHYVTLVGLDERNVYAMDPSAGPAYAFLPIKEFLDRWHDFEDRHGPRREYKHLAIFIHGARPLKGFPGPLVRME